MKIKEIMCKNPEYILKNTTLEEAAKKMQQLDCGFLPVGDQSKDKLIGTITDRDIVIRDIAIQTHDIKLSGEAIEKVSEHRKAA
jgi:predicted transcriptional regulator